MWSTNGFFRKKAFSSSFQIDQCRWLNNLLQCYLCDHCPQQFLYWKPFFCPLVIVLSVFPTSMNSLPSLCSVSWVGCLGDNNPTLVPFNETKSIPVLSSELKIMQENKCRNCKPDSHTFEITGQHMLIFSTHSGRPQSRYFGLPSILWVTYQGLPTGASKRMWTQTITQNSFMVPSSEILQCSF